MIMDETIVGLPEEDSEEFMKLIEIAKELNHIIKPETPLLVYETFFMKVLREEEMSVNTFFKSLLIVIMWHKLKGIELGVDTDTLIKETIIH
jgi:hypothetical protein